jgi:Cu+-exporting ATPase
MSAPLTAEPATVDLTVGGMTCGACAAKISKKLNRLDGVAADVNFALGTAHVSYDPAVHSPDSLVDVVVKAGYSATAPDPDDPVGEATLNDAENLAAQRYFGRRALLAVPLAVAVVAIGMRNGFSTDDFGGSHMADMDMRNTSDKALAWISLGLTTPVVAWAAWPFHRAAVVNLRRRTATMDTLVSMGTLAAFVWSVVAVLRGKDELYFEVAAAVTSFLLLGRWAEARSKRRAGTAVRELLELGAKEVSRLDADGVEERVDVRVLRVGDRFLVRPGEKVATDGVILHGNSALDLSMLTGESVPVERGPGDEIVGGAVNSNGRLVVRATRVGSATALAQIARLVAQAQNGKASAQRLADRVAGIFVPVVLGIALATLLIWLAAGGSTDDAFSATVAVLIIACPCALGLATPTALLVGTGRGAQLGLLIRGPEVLERAQRLTAVVLDKTGTLTTGQMTVRSVTVPHGADTTEALRLVGALEVASEHPIGRAIAAYAAEAGPLPAVESFSAVEGLGAVGRVAGVDVAVGRPALLETHGLATGQDLQTALARAAEAGHTAVLGGWDGRARVVIAVGDSVRPEAAAAITDLRRLGLEPYVVTGDSAATAHAVARDVGIAPDHVVAEVLPADKVAAVERLRHEHRAVAMIGDGVNDAAALAEADLGLTMGGGADVAIQAGDITLVRGDLTAAPDAIRLARRTLSTIRANLFWAFAYNVAAIPLAATGLLNPMIAGAAMALSSVFVVSNSLRLRRFS